jgi:hypothetical protein
MSLMDLIDKARADKAGELSDIAQGEGSVLEKAQQAAEGLGEGSGDGADAPPEPPSKS